MRQVQGSIYEPNIYLLKTMIEPIEGNLEELILIDRRSKSASSSHHGVHWTVKEDDQRLVD